MTYLGRVKIARQNKITTKEKFPDIRARVHTWQIAIGWYCYVKSLMWIITLFALQITSFIYLGLLQRLRGSKLEMEQYVSILYFVIPIIVDVHCYRLEVYTLVSEIHENVDLVLGIKNVFELEGVNKFIGNVALAF